MYDAYVVHVRRDGGADRIVTNEPMSSPPVPHVAWCAIHMPVMTFAYHDLTYNPENLAYDVGARFISPLRANP